MAAQQETGQQDEIRIGIIGAGGIMGGHVKRLAGTKGKVVAMADPSAASIERLKGVMGGGTEVAAFSDWEKMLAEVELDAVEIGSPHTVHFDQICAALDKGLHVLTEKPMTCTSAHAREVIKRAKEADKVVGVSYQRHYAGTYRFIHEMVTSGKLGKIHFVSAFQGQEWLRSQTGTWRQTMALSGGGQLNDSGSHLMDAIMWTTGLQAEEVSCRSDFFEREVDINSALNVKFACGALGTIAVVGSAPTGFREDISIVGSEGVIFYRNGELTWQQSSRGPILKLEKGKDWMDPDSNFIGAIKGICEIGCPPEVGLRVIEITEAAWRSHEKNGQPVKVERND